MLKQTILCAWFSVLLAVATPILGSGEIIVNGAVLDETTIAQMEAAYRTRLVPGRYWYDQFSGAWGYEGGPASGQIAPYLPLGDALSANASGGGTNVFINGRELHPIDVERLIAIFGSVQPGRYWVNAQGIGGFEGGPAFFNLNASAAAGSGGSGYNRNTTGGGLMSDGGCSGYLHPDGTTVMTGDC